MSNSVSLQASSASCTITNQASPRPANPADPSPDALGVYDVNGVMPGVVGVVVYGVLVVGVPVVGVGVFGDDPVGVTGAGVEEPPTVTESFMPALQCPGMRQMK
jgi:hypothetical protein